MKYNVGDVVTWSSYGRDIICDVIATGTYGLVTILDSDWHTHAVSENEIMPSPFRKFEHIDDVVDGIIDDSSLAEKHDDGTTTVYFNYNLEGSGAHGMFRITFDHCGNSAELKCIASSHPKKETLMDLFDDICAYCVDWDDSVRVFPKFDGDKVTFRLYHESAPKTEDSGEPQRKNVRVRFACEVILEVDGDADGEDIRNVFHELPELFNSDARAIGAEVMEVEEITDCETCAEIH